MDGFRLIVLDVDGVLNQSSTKERYRPGFIGFDPRNVAILNELWLKTGDTPEARAKFLISSSWRKLFTVENMIKTFHDHGVPGEILGRTGSHPTGIRGLEIQEWLEHHAPRDLGTGELLVQGLCILDDSNDMGHLRHKLVQTSPWRGLRGKHIPRALKILSEPLILSNRAMIHWKTLQPLDINDTQPISDKYVLED
jgi:hypothetical protein